ncbi:MAG TPA: radical SAM protein [Polyangiaceae bacterium]|jgi:cyclic pyranopterin phosphate synthase|nr:radical SAM protein [Polyangiaceae bacterium]
MVAASLPLRPRGRSLPLAGAAPRLPPRSARVSLTDRCDLACVYCRPSRADGYLESRLDEDAWRTMMHALIASGVRRVRITGGEPLLHPRVVERVAFVASLGIEDLALTTNATRLRALALPLREAGLRRITVSIDSLVPERFARITRGGDLATVLDGVDAALGAGFDEVKSNTVVLRGENDDELAAIVAWASARGVVPRFIELMRVGEGARLPAEALVGASEMRARLADLLEEVAGERDPDRGPARYVALRGAPRLRVGFITGSTDTYCDACDRLRVASDGVLRPCLATNDGVAAKTLAEAGDVEGIVGAIADAWAMKPDGETWKGCTESTAADVSMRAIGG